MAAWAVHALTASGLILALLAIEAVGRGDWRVALLWLLAALGVDGIDGTLARAVRIDERLPRIDGAALDLIVDYLTYVFVPALLVWRAEMLPTEIALPLVASILVSSLYVFARRDMKTDDGYFRGFPALWNVVAVYFVLIPLSPELAAAIVTALVLLTFSPIHVVHPFRVTARRPIAAGAATIWMMSTTALLLGVPAQSWWNIVLGLSLVSLAGLALLGLIRTVRGPITVAT
jgi:phosphatidylcholine synthase